VGKSGGKVPPFTPYWRARFLPVAWQKFLQTIEYRPLRSWFYFVLHYQAWAASEGWGPAGSYFEFGTGEGTSLAQYADALNAFARHTKTPLNRFRIVGFDTFEGLPPTSDPRDSHPGFTPGRFAGSTDRIRQVLLRKGIPTRGCDLQLIPGKFEESLTPELRSSLQGQPPSLVNIDVDYFSATQLVLEWIRPILRSGTIVYFDDLWLFAGNPQYGELAAIREFNARGPGALEPFPLFASPAIAGHAYIFHRPEFEWRTADLGSSIPKELP
jgi:hypothetical protein